MVLVLGAAAHAGMPYLPQIGPPPLRVQPKSSSTAVFKIVEAPAPAVTNSPAILPAGNFPGETNSTAADPLSLASATAPVSLEDTFASSVFTLPTPDLLGLTPQMLATYFHPVQFGTNAALAVPFRVSFLPPVPPDKKSSRAEYIVK